MSAESLLKKYQSITDIRNRYFAIAEKADAEKQNLKPAPDKWSMNQVMMHLYNTEDFILQFVQRRLTKDKLGDTGIKNSLKFLMLNIILKLPLKFKAPKALAPLPDIIDFQQLKADWLKVDDSFRLTLKTYPTNLEGKEIFKHPFTGELNINQTLAFILDHMEHHQFQMGNLAK